MRLPTMPQIYIDEVKATGGAAAKCHACKEPTNRSLCPTHLLLAARRFRKWTAKRHRMGLCILCEKEGDMLPPLGDRRTRRGIRCAFHRGINAEKCRRWSAENGPRLFRERKRLGVCVSSPRHGPATHGNLCAACRLRTRESRQRHERRLKASGTAKGRA